MPQYFLRFPKQNESNGKTIEEKTTFFKGYGWNNWSRHYQHFSSTFKTFIENKPGRHTCVYKSFRQQKGFCSLESTRKSLCLLSQLLSCNDKSSGSLTLVFILSIGFLFPMNTMNYNNKVTAHDQPEQPLLE